MREEQSFLWVYFLRRSDKGAEKKSNKTLTVPMASLS